MRIHATRTAVALMAAVVMADAGAVAPAMS